MAPPEAKSFDILISGASFAGLALARALSTAFDGSIRIAVVERSVPGTAPVADARAFALSAATKRMLSVVGVWERVAADAQEVTGIDITDSGLESGIRPVYLSYDNHIAEGEPATYIVPAAILASALNEAVAQDKAVSLLRPAQVEGYSAGAARVDAALAGGEHVSASLLVAADGRKSPLRDAAGIKVVGWNHGQTGIVTTISHTRPHRARAVQHFLPGGPFAILPLPADRSCITWSEDAEEARRILALGDADFLAEVETRVGGRLGTIALAGPRQSWPLEMHLARSYVAPHFVVIGDAAHGVHPIAGQGLNLAFRDVAALTEVLADGARLGLDLGDGELLARYQRWRRFDSTLSAATFDGLNLLFSNDWTLVRAARDFGLGLVDRMPGVKEYFVREAAGLSGELPRLLKGEPV